MRFIYIEVCGSFFIKIVTNFPTMTQTKRNRNDLRGIEFNIEAENSKHGRRYIICEFIFM